MLAAACDRGSLAPEGGSPAPDGGAAALACDPYAPDPCLSASAGAGALPPAPDPRAEILRKAAEEGRIGLLSTGDDDAGAPEAGAPDAALPPGVHPRIRMGSLSSAEQPIAPALTKAVRAIEPDLLACYSRGLARQPGLRGRVAVRFVVNPLGEISSVGNGGSDLPDSGVVSCVVKLVYRLRIDPPPAESTPIKLPLLFSPA